MKTWIKTAASFSLCSLLFAGCSSAPQPVSEADAPSELLKKAASIAAESSAQDVIDVLEGMIDATYQATDGKLILSEKATGKGIDTESETLAAKESSLSTYDVRVATEKHFYQLYEESSSGSDPVNGLMNSSQTGLTTVYTSLDEGTTLGNPQGKMTINAIDAQTESQEISEEQMSDYIENSVVYPFYTMLGSTLVVQPTSKPEYYDFKLEKAGGSYIWTISIADQETYNTALDETFEQYYGHSRLDVKGDQSLVLDTYQVDTVTMAITTDENGAIEKIENKNRSTVTMGDTSLSLSSDDTVKVSKADDSWVSFFEGFFISIADGSLKENDSFVIGQTFEGTGSTAEESSKAASDDKAQDDKKDSAKEDSASKESSEGSSEKKSVKNSSADLEKPSRTSEASSEKSEK